MITEQLTKSLEGLAHGADPSQELTKLTSDEIYSLQLFVDNLNNQLQDIRESVLGTTFDLSSSHPLLDVGIKSAKGNLIALLDTKTLPAPDWLETYRNFLYQNGVDAIFGSTTFSYKTNFQRAVRAASYGSIAHETVPGSLFYKEVGIRIPFKENLRAAYDLDWKIRLRDEFKTFTPMNSFVSYSQFPSSIFSLVKKYG